MVIPQLQIIILVFGLYLTVTFSKVLADEKIQQSVPCKEGWYFFGEKCYRNFPVESNEKESSWTNSQNLCAWYEGDLASIHSKELQEFLTVFLLLNSKSNSWIGLHDRETELEFSWVDGSIYNYKNWETNNPPRKNTEDCVEMRYKNFKDGIASWNQENCNSLRNFVCQKDKDEDIKSPDPRFCSIEDGGGWKYLNSCYHIVTEKKTWEDAEKYCEEKYKGYLVTILEDNAEVFLNYIGKLSGGSTKFWIGIKMRNDSVQKWESGWHVVSKKIKDLLFEDGTCVIKTNLNSWATAPCRNKYSFICEKMKYNVPVLQKPPSDDWECPHSGENWVDVGGEYCYYIETTSSRTWLEANYECGQKGGTLASFHSEIETNILHHHVIDTKDRLLIGIRRSYTNNRVFEWADGTNVTYTNWNKGEPNDYNEKCSEIWTESMKWNDIPCNIAKGYICKTPKIFSKAKFQKYTDQGIALSTNSSNELKFKKHLHQGTALSTNSSCVPIVTVVGILFCGVLLGLLVGVVVYHYKDNWMIYFTRKEKNGYASVKPSSIGAVSDKVLWKPQGEEHY